MSHPSRNYAVILPTAGKSSRFGSVTDPAAKKPFLDLAGQPVWYWSAELFAKMPHVHELLIVLAPEDRSFFEHQFSERLAALRRTVMLKLVDGGAERCDSVQSALHELDDATEMVAIHDAARPCVTSTAVASVFSAAEQYGAAILAAPIVGTIKRAFSMTQGEPVVEATVPREHLWEAQTPQVFRRCLILEAYSARCRLCPDHPPTDDAQLVELQGDPVALVSSDRMNIKITTPADLSFAEMLLRSR